MKVILQQTVRMNLALRRRTNFTQFPQKSKPILIIAEHGFLTRLSAEDWPDGFGVLFDQPYRASVDFDLHFFVVEAELLQDRGLEIADIMPAFQGSITDVVRASVNRASLDACACQPRREALRIVISSSGVLGPRGSTEFAGPDDQGAFEQSALF